MGNQVEEVINEKGLNAKWVLAQINSMGIKMGYHKFYRIRTNRQDPTTKEAIFLAEILKTDLKKISYG